MANGKIVGHFDLTRTLIIGNGGAGKSWLASRLGRRLSQTIVHLDDILWLPGNRGIARDRAERDRDVRRLAEQPSWIMEGIYGQLADMVLPRTTTLVWIDLSETECIANVRNRGPKPGESGEQFEDLVSWVAAYRTRANNWNSFERHERLFQQFAGGKIALENRNAVSMFAATAGAK